MRLCQSSKDFYRAKEMLNRRPRLLFLAYRFPPAGGIACVRSWNIAKYLARSGWDVTVVTPHSSIWRRVENSQEIEANVKQEGIRCILTGHQWRWLMPDLLNCWNQGLGWLAGGICRTILRRLGVDTDIGWIKSVEQACATLTVNDVDLILATAVPFSAFVLAERLSKRFGCPYVLDYRDPWTENPHDAQLIRPTVIQKEARLLMGCAAVTIVSCSWGWALDRRFGLGQKLHVITNGYDPEELTDVEPYDYGHFAIVYTGSFYPPKRIISPLMDALKCLKLTLEGSEWYFHYYGEHEDHVREEARRFGVMERTVLHGSVPRTEALSAVRGADVAVVITSVTEEATAADQGIVTGKVFEALGLGTPILLVAPPGSDAAEIVEGSGMGQRVTGTDIEGITRFLSDIALAKHKAGTCPDKYSWPVLANKLNKILRDIVLQKYANENAAYLSS